MDMIALDEIARASGLDKADLAFIETGDVLFALGGCPGGRDPAV